MTQILTKARCLALAAVLVTLLSTGVALRPVAAAGPDVAFSANTSGSFTLSSCPLLGVLRTGCVLHLSGTGTSTPIGAVTESGTLIANLNLLPLQCGRLAGVETLTATQTPTDSITALVSGQVCAPLLGGILGGNAPYNLTYRIIRGTGSFSGASGTGSISGHAQFHLLAGNGTYNETWSGSLTP